ncbi:accessory factor UbiK family protein, partial [Acinetobacter baumannii]
TAFRAQAERFIGDMDLVKREEFDVLREMVIRLREENAELKTRLEALESRLPVPAKTDETV